MVEEIIKELSSTLSSKGGEYKDSVIGHLPLKYWLAQIVIKANRAEMATKEAKLRDELIDTACYCILALDKIDREGSGLA